MNRKIASIIVVSLLLTIAAVAQNAPVTKVGIINIQQAIVSTNEGQRDFAALQKKFEPKQAELQAANTEIEGLKKQLTAQEGKLNDDARNNLVKSIDAKQKTLQRSAEDAQGDFQNQQNEIANRIGTKLVEVMDKYAKDNGFAVILDVSSPQSPVIWAAQTSDLTKNIVDAYNVVSGVPAPSTAAAPGTAAPKATTPAKPAAPPAKKP